LTESKKSPFQYWYPKFIWILAILLLVMLLWHPSADFLELISDQEAVSAYVKSFGLLGPIVLGLIQLIAIIIPFLPGHAAVVAGGYIYGLWYGYLFNLIVIVGSSQIAFSLARRAGRPLVDKLIHAKDLDRWDEAADQHGFIFFFTTFFLPIFPADIINYVGGLSSISEIEFFIANLFGRVPVVMFMTAIGAKGLELAALDISLLEWLFIGLSGIAIIAVVQIISQRIKKRFLSSRVDV
jgi:uncharacterized membrane protein YdjX (TVP38/TMEM64 family)